MIEVKVKSSSGGFFLAAMDPNEKDKTCKRCPAVIRFVHTKSGKRMPVDVVKDQDGVYVSHFATCPAAASFRSITALTG